MNLKLDLVRMTSEDVITTSGLACEKKDHYIFLYDDVSEDIPFYNLDVYKYDSGTGKYIYETNVSVDYPSSYFNGVVPTEGDVFYVDVNGKYSSVECEHNLYKPIG